MISIIHVIDHDGRSYFGLSLSKDSKEMHNIKSIAGRKWHSESKLWLVPYSSENWKRITFYISRANMNISREPKKMMVMKTNNNQSNNKKKLNQDVQPKKQLIVLSENYEQAILFMKEQLLINRYTYNTQLNYLSSFREFLCYYPNEEVNNLTIKSSNMTKQINK